MDRDNEHLGDKLIDLGAASAETKGPFGVEQDEALGILGAGLSDD